MTDPEVASPNEPRTDPGPGGMGPVPEPAAEIGGRKGPEPTRFGDWEKNGRCIDF